MKITIALALIFSVLLVGVGLSSMVSASEQGFIYRGRSYLVYRDGKKVGKDSSEFLAQLNSATERNPSAERVRLQNNNELIYFYFIDNNVKCYHIQNEGTLSCVNVNVLLSNK